VRRWLLIGDVSLVDGSYDSPRGHSLNGVDTESRCELVSVLMALRVAHVRDRRTYQLLRRDIGRPCINYRHEDQGHCDRIPLREMPLLAEMSWQEAEEETERAIAWLLDLYAEPHV